MIRSYTQHYKGLSSETWIGILASLFEATLVGIFSFMMVYFTSVLNIDVISAGKIISCYGVGTIIGAIMSGKLVDQFKPQTVSTACLFLQAICYLALTYQSHVNSLMITMFISGVASYGFITANYTLTLSQCDIHSRFKAINILEAASNLGFGLAGALISFIQMKYFPHLFTLISIFLIFIGLFVINREYNVKNNNHLEECSQLHLAGGAHFPLLTILSLVLAGGILVSQYSSTYPIYLKEIFPAMGNSSFGILFMMNAWMVVLFQTPILNYISHIHHSILIGLGLFFLGNGLWMLNISSVYFLAILGCSVMTIGEMMFFSTAQWICYESGDQHKKASSLGKYRAIFALGKIIGPFVGATLYETYGAVFLYRLFFFAGLGGLLISLRQFAYSHASSQKS